MKSPRAFPLNAETFLKKPEAFENYFRRPRDYLIEQEISLTVCRISPDNRYV